MFPCTLIGTCVYYYFLKTYLRIKNNTMESSNCVKMILFSKKKCLICCEEEDEFNLGVLHDLQVFSVHYLCLLTGMNSYPSTNNGGLLGFLLDDIYRLYKTYTNIICEYCKKSGGSLECCLCKKKYHLPCGIKNGVRIEMLGTYPSYCKDCAYETFPKSNGLRKFICAICYSSAETEDDILYWPKCCKPEQMIHFDCLKLYALSAGYLMRCPLCMNKAKFRSNVRKFGVYIPNSDADWLIEKPDKFISYPLRCCANVCIMDSSYRKMSTVLTPCIICDWKIAHMECTFSAIFFCVDCTKKLWPDIGKTNLKSNEIANLSDTFPWFSRLIGMIKYGKTLGRTLNKIVKSLGEKIHSHETVYWHDILDIQSSNLIATKIIECYEDSVSKNFTGEPSSKKVKR